MQFCMEPGLTIFVADRACVGFDGAVDGGDPIGTGPPGGLP